MRRLLLVLACAPALAGEVGELLAGLEAEAERRRGLGREAEADALAAEVRALRERLDGGVLPASSETEVHVVALRTGAPAAAGGVRRGRASVHVTCARRPLFLVLCSYDPILWELEVAPGVDFKAIYTAGDARHWVSGVRGSLVMRLGETAAWRRDFPEYAQLEHLVAERTACDVATFLGLREPPAEGAIEVGPGNPAWQEEHLRWEARRLLWRATREVRARTRDSLRSLRFEAVYHYRDGGALRSSVGACTPLGPLLAEQTPLPAALAGAAHAARDPRTGRFFTLAHGAAYGVSPRGWEPVALEVPEAWPVMRDPSALALDLRRRRLLVATGAARGYLYAFDLDHERWSVVNDMDGVEASGLVHDAGRDVLFAVESADSGLVLHRFTAEEGTHTSAHPLALAATAGKGRPVQLACTERGLVLLLPPHEALEGFEAGVPRIALVDPATGRVVHLAALRPLEALEPPTPARLEQLWSRLGETSRVADRAARALAGGGEETVRFLAARFRRPGAPDAEGCARWFALLDHRDPAARGYAQARLVALGVPAKEEVARAFDAAETPEARLRLRAVLDVISAAGPVTPALERELRAIRVLEQIETPGAEAALQELAAEASGTWIMRAEAAREALRRMNRPR